MQRALILAYAVLTSLFIVVSVVGYWSYGNAVSGFLLTMFDHPRWVVTLANVVCLIQLMVSEQVLGGVSLCCECAMHFILSLLQGNPAAMPESSLLGHVGGIGVALLQVCL